MDRLDQSLWTKLFGSSIFVGRNELHLGVATDIHKHCYLTCAASLAPANKQRPPNTTGKKMCNPSWATSQRDLPPSQRRLVNNFILPRYWLMSEPSVLRVPSMLSWGRWLFQGKSLQGSRYFQLEHIHQSLI